MWGNMGTTTIASSAGCMMGPPPELQKVKQIVMVSKEDIPRRTLMQSEIKDAQKADVKKTGSKVAATQKSYLQSIIKRSRLRVGYNPENLPFSYHNDKGDLVGFDVELMNELARELDPAPYQAARVRGAGLDVKETAVQLIKDLA